MKNLIRKIFSPSQRQQLYRCLDRSSLGFEKVGASVINVLPAGMKVFLRSHLKVVKEMDYPKERVLLNVSSSMENKVRLHSCRKEPETIQWIEVFFKDMDVFFDVGANVGAYSLVAAKHFKGKVSVYSFEPSFLNFPQLCTNIYLNQCSDSVIPFNIAFSNKTNLDFFNYRTLIVGGAMHSLGEAKDDFNEHFVPVFKQAMLSYTMDDFIQEFNLPIPQHIKIDVDGNEWLILQGAEKTLESSKVKSILIEMVEGEKHIYDYILKKGFTLHQRFTQKDPRLSNCIFKK